MFIRNGSIANLVFLYTLFVASSADAWDIETVDSLGVVGAYASIAISPAGIPHISYYDDSANSLKYATKSASGWVIETVDTGNVGQHSSIALAGNGVLHISYYDAANGELKRAWKNGGPWTVETVDTTGDVGQFSSIAINPVNQPVISYYDATNPSIKVAYLEGTWEIKRGPDATLVSATSLKLAAVYPYPLVAYFDGTDRKLKLAIYDLGGSLPTNTVNAQGWGTEDVVTSATIIDSISMTLASSAEPRISYAEATTSGGSVRFIAKNCIASGCLTQTTPTFPTGQGSWGTAETVQDIGFGPAFTSLVIGGNGDPQISYFDSTATAAGQNLQFAIKSGGIWTLDNVDTQGVVGLHSSLGLDALGNPHIAYYDETNSDLKYAHLGAASNPDICVESMRVLSRFPKVWGIDFKASADPTCKVTDAVVNLQSGNQMNRDTSGHLTCIPSSNTWSGEGTPVVSVNVNPDLDSPPPTSSFRECITDSLGFYWDSGQSITVNLSCSSGAVSLTGLYDDFYDVYDNVGAFKTSRARLGGACTPPGPDFCPYLPGWQSIDSDGDGLGDACDNCPNEYNPGQEDADGDSIGDVCEPECRDGLDNDEDGDIDHPNDAQCDGPDDDKEAGELEICLPLSKKFVATSEHILFGARDRDFSSDDAFERQGSIWDWFDNRYELAAAQLAVARYVFCPEINKEAAEYEIGELVDFASRICFTGPIGFDVPERCPPLDCRIDGPGCMDPYQHVMVELPDQALVVAALGAQEILTRDQMNSSFAEMIANDEIKIRIEPRRVRYIPQITVLAGLMTIVILIIIGLAIGRSMGWRRGTPD